MSNSNQRPPLMCRKGITVLQPSRTHKLIDSQQDSGSRSLRSSGRSRGISIGRSSGIQMDKIYEQKHFQPQQQPSSNMEKTLNSCKSLKLVSLQSQTSLDHKEYPQEGKPVKEAQKNLNQEESKNRMSPIGRLKQSEPTSKLSENEKQRKLIHF